MVRRRTAKAKCLFCDFGLSFWALGGYEEVGRNCFAVQNKASKEILLMDCGALFTEEAELVEGAEPDPFSDIFSDFLPDFGWVKTNIKNLVGIFVSHAHLDHILGLLALFRLSRTRKQEPVIFCSQYAAQTIRNLFIRLKQKPPENFHLINQATKKVEAGGFCLYPVEIAHSIPQTFSAAVAVQGCKDAIMFYSDGKWQPSQFDSRLDSKKVSERLGSLASKLKVRLVVQEALYCDREGITGSDDQVIEPFSRILKEKRGGKVVATFFASHSQRLESLVGVCLENKLKYASLGTAMTNSIETGRGIGLNLPKAEETTAEKADVIFCSGCQGEPGSAMNRIAKGNHREYQLGEEDVIVLMTEIIPGYEENICNQLVDLYFKAERIFVTPNTKKTVEVYLRHSLGVMFGDLWNGDSEFFPIGLDAKLIATEDIHTSGHGSQQDLRFFVQPFVEHQPKVIGYHYPPSKKGSWEDYVATLTVQ